MSKGLGRIPAGFKEHHVCDECKEFKPLWDMSYGKWCDDCVRNNGGLLKAGEIARDRWRAEIEARRAAREASRPQLTLVERQPAVFHVGSAESRNAGADIPGAAEDSKRLATMIRAEALHKAMKCSVEEAYDRLLAADQARNGT